LAYLTSAIASINVWNRLGVAWRWTPPARQKDGHTGSAGS
ncbi:MAG TPA: carboxymuconolactone decarboxylase family protein, partial [Bradyrhizobium sp.]